MSDREWVNRLVREGSNAEVIECMGDLLDRAKFAEEIARRNILERLVRALEAQPMSSIGAEALAVLRELDALRRGAA